MVWWLQYVSAFAHDSGYQAKATYEAVETALKTNQTVLWSLNLHCKVHAVGTTTETAH